MPDKGHQMKIVVVLIIMILSVLLLVGASPFAFPGLFRSVDKESFELFSFYGQFFGVASGLFAAFALVCSLWTVRLQQEQIETQLQQIAEGQGQLLTIQRQSQTIIDTYKEHVQIMQSALETQQRQIDAGHEQTRKIVASYEQQTKMLSTTARIQALQTQMTYFIQVNNDENQRRRILQELESLWADCRTTS